MAPLRHPGPITGVAFGRDGQLFLTACEDGYVRVWRKAPGHAVTALPHSPKPGKPNYREYVVTAVAFHPSGEKVATVGKNGEAQFWSVTTGMRDGKPVQHPPEVTTVAFLRDGETVLTGGVDGQVRFWDLKTRTEAGQRLDHPGEVMWLSLSHDGSRILTGCTDGKARLWDVKTRKPIGEPLKHNHSRAIGPTAISPDNKWMLTGSSDGTVRLWNENGKRIAELQHQNKVTDVNFSPDGTRVVTSSHDRSVRVWDAATGNLQTTLLHPTVVFSAVFTSDSKRVLTGSRDGAQMWDVQSRRRVGPICRYKDDVMHAALSPDGKIAALADWKGYGVLWRLPQPLQGDAERITWWVRAAVGMKLDEGGGREVLDGGSWQELQKWLQQLGRPP
jgi:WD40 repeat protein